MSFLRSTGPGSDGTDGGASVRPRFGSPVEPSPQPENLLTRTAADEGHAAHEATPREPASYERDSRSAPTPPEKCVNVIAAGSRWKGSLNISDSVRVDGQLSGDIEAKGTVHIAEGAMVEAKVKAAFVVICGSFKGEVRCLERLELLPKSKVQGELVTKVLNVHEGATIDGSIRMSADKVDAKAAEEAEATVGAEPSANGSRRRAEV